MNGPEHYKEAERLVAKAMSKDFLDFATEQQIPEEDMTAALAVAIAAAQVHATLALAAATAEPVARICGSSPELNEAWSKAIS